MNDYYDSIPFRVTPEEAELLLEKIRGNGDTEEAHIDADATLCALLRFYGCPESVISAYHAIDKWFA